MDSPQHPYKIHADQRLHQTEVKRSAVYGGGMRTAILQLPETRTAKERRAVLRTASRQLERADMYLAAVAYMELGDREAQRALNQLRTDLESLRRHLGERRNQVTK
jgi:hypothetical protein